MMRITAPDGCAHCGISEAAHLRRWSDGIGWHTWAEPSAAQREARLLARREPDGAGAGGAVPEGPEEADDLLGEGLQAFLDAVALMRERAPYERAVVAEIRARDAGLGDLFAAADPGAGDRRTLLGLYDYTRADLAFALQDNDRLEAHLAALATACGRLTEHARRLARNEPERADGIHRAVNVITRALRAPFEKGA